MNYILCILLNGTVKHERENSQYQGPLFQIRETCIYNCIFYELMTKKDTHFILDHFKFHFFVLRVCGLLLK